MAKPGILQEERNIRSHVMHRPGELSTLDPQPAATKLPQRAETSADNPHSWGLPVDLHQAARDVERRHVPFVLGRLAEELVELRTDEEHDRRDVEVRRDDEE